MEKDVLVRLRGAIGSSEGKWIARLFDAVGNLADMFAGSEIVAAANVSEPVFDFGSWSSITAIAYRLYLIFRAMRPC